MERSQIDAILVKTDLVSLVEQAGGVPHKSYGAEMRCACPLHAGKNASAFAIYTGNDGLQMWKCFSGDCGGGDAISFVMAWKKLRFPEAIKFLGGEPLTMEQEAKLAIERAERAAKWAEQAAREAREAIESLKSTEVWMRYHEQMNDEARAMWEARGVPLEWQEIWKLGYCKSKPYETKQGKLYSPSLTIPFFTHGWDVLYLKHRLLHPLDPKDKYRPETVGLKMPPYICDPDMPIDKTENILFIEGEIKSQVTYITLDSPKWQVVGIPGKDAGNIKKELIETYKGRNCIVCFDPDGRKQAEEFAHALNGRMFTLPVKIDDLIVKHGMQKETLRGVLKQGQKV